MLMPRLSFERIINMFALLDDLWEEVVLFLNESMVSLLLVCLASLLLLYGVYVVAIIVLFLMVAVVGYAGVIIVRSSLKKLRREVHCLAAFYRGLLNQPRYHVKWWR